MKLICSDRSRSGTAERRGRMILKGHEGTFRGDGYVHYLDCGGRFMVYANVKTFQIVHFKYKQFRDFPGCPVVGMRHFHCRGLWFDPWSGSYDSACCAVWP